MERRKAAAFGMGAAVLLLGLYAWSNGLVGIPSRMLEQDARKSQQIPSDWLVAMDCNETMGGLLFYPADQSDFVCSVYVKGAFGYHFRLGGSVSGVEDGVQCLIGPDGSTLLMSMNHPGVVQMELNGGRESGSIHVDPGRPFVYAIPSGTGAVSLYDGEGRSVSLSATELG